VGSILRLGAVLAAALVLLPAAGPNGATGSGLYGTVRKGPVTPACRQGVPCDAPARVTLVFSRATSSDGTMETDQFAVRPDRKGRYRIALDPGYWDVSATRKVGTSTQPKPHAVHVRRGHWDRINLFFDTGIR
jgi:hypothetical protein